jgi:hypothetical protein
MGSRCRHGGLYGFYPDGPYARALSAIATRCEDIITLVMSSGSFNNALGSDNPYGIRFENEHNEILIEGKDSSRYKIIQIAGFVHAASSTL